MSSDLPLRPSAFAVLAALTRDPRTGIEILDEVEAAGESILGPGTLYRLLRELRDLGWIERVAPPPGDRGLLVPNGAGSGVDGGHRTSDGRGEDDRDGPAPRDQDPAGGLSDGGHDGGRSPGG